LEGRECIRARNRCGKTKAIDITGKSELADCLFETRIRGVAKPGKSSQSELRHCIIRHEIHLELANNLDCILDKQGDIFTRILADVHLIKLVQECLAVGQGGSIELFKENHQNLGSCPFFRGNDKLEVLTKDLGARVENSFSGPQHVSAIMGAYGMFSKGALSFN
jgi:hypothetical protein